MASPLATTACNACAWTLHGAGATSRLTHENVSSRGWTAPLSNGFQNVSLHSRPLPPDPPGRASRGGAPGRPTWSRGPVSPSESWKAFTSAPTVRCGEVGQGPEPRGDPDDDRGRLALEGFGDEMQVRRMPPAPARRAGSPGRSCPREEIRILMRSRSCVRLDVRPAASLQSRWVRSRRALPITLTEERAIAAAAMMGESSSPKTG